MILINVPIPGKADSQVYTFTGNPEKIKADIMATIPHPQNKQALQAYLQGLEETKQRRAHIDRLTEEVSL